jgi:ribosomal protein L32E
MKFLRRISNRYSKLGKGRKKKQVWRNPTGRHNKMREKRRGYPATVSIGYAKDKDIRGKLQERVPVMVYSVGELEKIKENEIAVIGNVGKKKKIEMAKKAQEMKIALHNLNAKKFLKENEMKKKKQTKEKKK